MPQGESLQSVRQEIDPFIKKMIYRQNVDIDWSCAFSIDRFLMYVSNNQQAQEEHFKWGTHSVNEYMVHLLDSGKSGAQVRKITEAIISFSEHINQPVNKEEVTIPEDSTGEVPTVEEEEDIYQIEKQQYEKVIAQNEGVYIDKKPTLQDVTLNPYGNFRDEFRNYLLFRLAIETGLYVSEIVHLNVESVNDDGELVLEDRTIPLSNTTKQVFYDYIDFRKQYDLPIWVQKVMYDIDNGGIGITKLYLDKEKLRFFHLSPDEKTEEIRSLVMEKFTMEEEVEQLEQSEEDINEEKIDELDDRIEKTTEQIYELKEIVEFEMQINQASFNPAMFVTSRYARISEEEVKEILEREALPLEVIKATIKKRWQDAGFKRNQTEKFLGQKPNRFGSSNQDSLFQDFIHAGFTFHNRIFF
ncbi:site-specific integrase [Texcoconibacillus texcoconensis]|uniref:Site-specific recombinase XerD n=1 Tax=Texcoconibacillus texcoconensis TaxID=1095777 RepID=A0A840QQV8_9BACI|nr:site-specific integrase [Texcoconibacillus texcoconensis]MBB5173711.1 site-specific recombinase XerD [Texcoconibacillus texcoconensis]